MVIRRSGDAVDVPALRAQAEARRRAGGLQRDVCRRTESHFQGCATRRRAAWRSSASPRRGCCRYRGKCGSGSSTRPSSETAGSGEGRLERDAIDDSSDIGPLCRAECCICFHVFGELFPGMANFFSWYGEPFRVLIFACSETTLPFCCDVASSIILRTALLGSKPAKLPGRQHAWATGAAPARVLVVRVGRRRCSAAGRIRAVRLRAWL